MKASLLCPRLYLVTLLYLDRRKVISCEAPHSSWCCYNCLYGPLNCCKYGSGFHQVPMSVHEKFLFKFTYKSCKTPTKIFEKKRKSHNLHTEKEKENGTVKCRSMCGGWATEHWSLLSKLWAASSHVHDKYFPNSRKHWQWILVLTL